MPTGMLLTRGEVAKRLGVAARRVPELEYWHLSPIQTERGRCYHREEVDALLTRQVVARRLGKSVAAVRAIEGTLLHPAEGPNGVRLFDADEVDKLVGRPLGVNAHSQWFRRRSDAPWQPAEQALGRGEVERLRREIERLSGENAELRAIIAEVVGAYGDGIYCSARRSVNDF